MSCGLVDRLVTEFPVVLASASPRRARILEAVGLEFAVDRALVDESAAPDEEPHEHVLRLSLAKALEVAGRYRRGTVLGGDTIVVLDGRLLCKPEGPDEALRMLTSLSGRWHEVYTGIAAVRCSDRAVSQGYERTRVLMRQLDSEEIRDYVSGGEPLDKAGSYGIQECGAAVVERVEGCFYNVAGLPVVRLCEVLKRLRGERA